MATVTLHLITLFLGIITCTSPSEALDDQSVAAEFPDCTRVALSSTNNKTFWESHDYPSGTLAEEQCWVFYVIDSLSDDYYIRLHIEAAPEDPYDWASPWLKAFDSHERKGKNKLFAASVQKIAKSYLDKNFTACSQAMWMTYSHEKYKALQTQGVMGGVQLVSKTSSVCGVTCKEDKNIISYIGVIFGGVIAVASGIVWIFCFFYHKSKYDKRRSARQVVAQTPGQPALGQPTFGQPGIGNQQYGQPPFGQQQFGQQQFGQQQFGQQQFGQQQFGQQPFANQQFDNPAYGQQQSSQQAWHVGQESQMNFGQSQPAPPPYAPP